jgi:hypothetical protein
MVCRASHVPFRHWTRCRCLPDSLGHKQRASSSPRPACYRRIRLARAAVNSLVPAIRFRLPESLQQIPSYDATPGLVPLFVGSHLFLMSEPLVIAKAGDTDLALLPGLANRHGCITGATGTGKTITLQVLAEQFSRIGVPVFLADVKGDLSGISKAGQMSEKLGARLRKLALPEPVWGGCPATLWDVFGEQGIRCEPPSLIWGRCSSPGC